MRSEDPHANPIPTLTLPLKGGNFLQAAESFPSFTLPTVHHLTRRVVKLGVPCASVAQSFTIRPGCAAQPAPGYRLLP